LRWWIVLLLAVATPATFAAVANHDFVNFDDRVYVLDNPLLQAPLSLPSLRRAFAPYHDNWVPLTWISLHIDYALYGPSAPAFLRTNVALHTAGAILLFLALSRMTGAVGRSAFVAAVFALHPLHVESVAWVSERKDTLSGLFWMLSLYAYAAYAERPASATRWAAVCGSLALGLLAKPVLVTLPIALLLLDFWPLGRLSTRAQRRRALLEKLPLLALCIAAGAITLPVQRAAHAMILADQLPVAMRIANALEAIGAYLGASFWPSGLAAFYPYPLDGLAVGRTAACALLLALITLVCLRGARRAPYAIVGWAWFIVTLAPTLGLLQVGLQARADRYTYIPLIGVAIAVAWGAADLAGSRRWRQHVAAGLGVAACAALAVTAFRQVDHWRNTLALFEHAARVTSDNYYAHNAIAGVHLEAGRLEAAETHYREALRAAPGWAEPHLGLANVLVARRDLDAAVASYRRALEIDPNHPVAHLQLGIVELERGQAERARTHLESAMALARESTVLDAESAELQAALGIALARTGHPLAARPHLEAALQRRPELAAARLELARLLSTRRGNRTSHPPENPQTDREPTD